MAGRKRPYSAPVQGELWGLVRLVRAPALARRVEIGRQLYETARRDRPCVWCCQPAEVFVRRSPDDLGGVSVKRYVTSGVGEAAVRQALKQAIPHCRGCELRKVNARRDYQDLGRGRKAAG